jgi:seryl-tRNA synthetase
MAATSTVPAKCRPIQQEIDGLKAGRARLQAALQRASTPEKPELAAEIKALTRQIATKNARLKTCVGGARP